jgi:hypothetical protein
MVVVVTVVAGAGWIRMWCASGVSANTDGRGVSRGWLCKVRAATTFDRRSTHAGEEVGLARVLK